MTQKKIGRIELKNKLKPYPFIPIINNKKFYYLNSGNIIQVYSENVNSRFSSLTRRSHSYLIKVLEGHRNSKLK